MFTNAYVAPVAAGSAAVAAVTGAILSAVRVESGSSVVKAVVAPGSVLATETRSWSGMSIVRTREASVSRTASMLKVVTRPVSARLASSSTPGNASKASRYCALPVVTVGGPVSRAARATPLTVTVEIASGCPPSDRPDALSAYRMTRGKSAATVTVSSGEVSVRSAAAVAAVGGRATRRPAASAAAAKDGITGRDTRRLLTGGSLCDGFCVRNRKKSRETNTNEQF